MKLLPHKVESYGLSDVGLIRPNNEDIFKILPEKQFFVLADGMGGHNAGEVASLKAVESMCTSISLLKENATVKEICADLRAAISSANQTVYALSHNNKSYS